MSTGKVSRSGKASGKASGASSRSGGSPDGKSLGKSSNKSSGKSSRSGGSPDGKSSGSAKSTNQRTKSRNARLKEAMNVANDKRRPYKTKEQKAAPDPQDNLEEMKRWQMRQQHVLRYKDEVTIIPMSTFDRLVRATYKYILGQRVYESSGTGKTKRVHRQALRLLHHAAQTMLIELMRDAQLLATHAKRPTVMDRDLIMAIKMNPRYQHMFLAPDDIETFDTAHNWIVMAERTDSNRVRIKPDVMPFVQAAKNARPMDVNLYTGRQKDALDKRPDDSDAKKDLKYAIQSSSRVLKTTACRRARDKPHTSDAEKVMDRASKSCRTAAMSKTDHSRDVRLATLIESKVKPKKVADYKRMRNEINPCAGSFRYDECKFAKNDDGGDDNDIQDDNAAEY